MIAGIVTDLTDWLDRISSHWWFLLIILVIAYLDSVIPIVPSETCVIIGGVAASLGHQNIYAVIGFAAVGAFLGDNTAYQIGLRASGAFRRRADRKPAFAKKMTWAEDQIAERGGLLLITARFIPGGRTALTLSCGITRQRRAWFIRWVAARGDDLGDLCSNARPHRRDCVRRRPHEGVPAGVRLGHRHERADRGPSSLTQEASCFGRAGSAGAVNRHLAQLNVATLRHPIDDPRTADFADALPIVNGAGEGSPGYVWRLQSDSGDATDIQVFDDPLIIVNLTVWESLEALKAFAYRGIHRDFFRRRAEWFVEGSSRYRALVAPCGHASDHRRRQTTARFHRGVRFLPLRIRDGPEPFPIGDRSRSGSTTPALRT